MSVDGTYLQYINLDYTQCKRRYICLLVVDRPLPGSWCLINAILCEIVSTEQDRTISIVAMSCVFNGPPRAGKTTVVRRLKGEDVDINVKTASTGVVDEKGVVRIDFIPSSNVVTDQEWVEMEEDDEVQAFLNLTIIPHQTGSDEDLLKVVNEISQTSHIDMPVHPPTIYDGASATIEVPSQTKHEASSLAVEAPPQKRTLWNRFLRSVKIIRKPAKLSKLQPTGNAPPPSVEAQRPADEAQLPSSTNDTLPVTGVPSATKVSSEHTSDYPQSDKKNVGDARNTHQKTEEYDGDMAELSPKSVLAKAQLHSQQIRATRRLCKRHFLYLLDTGGQPEFRKMIALLIPGQSLTFIVFNMCHEFDSSYSVRFCHRTNDDEIEYSSFSITGTINDIIEHLYCSELHSKVKGSIMFIGTHKDLIPKGEMEEIVERKNKELRLILEQCPHYNADMVIRSDDKDIIFCVDNSTFDTEHKCIRSSVLSICETERFQVKVKPELLLLALTLKGAKVTVLPFDKCAEVAMNCGIAKEDVKEALCLLHEKLMMIRVYELTKDEVIVIVKPKVLINRVSSLLKFMITRNKQAYSNPVVSHTKLAEIATDGEGMKTDMLIKVLVYLSIIAPIPKSGTEAVKEYFVPAMFPDSTPTEVGNTMSMGPSIFSDKAVTVRTEPNQLLFAIKPFKFSIPSTLHAPVLCSLLKDKQWTIQNAGRDQSKTCIILTKRMKSKPKNVTFTVTFYKECVSLCLGQEWNKSNVPHEMLEQCIHAMSSALHQSLTLVGYGDHNVFKYCFSCFEQSISSANAQDDCSISHIFTPAYPDNVWFLKVSIEIIPRYTGSDNIIDA